MVTTVCYGKEEKWPSRMAAVEYFGEGILCSEGSERDRYARIVAKLLAGENYATDEE